MYDVRCFFGGEDYRLQDYRIGVRKYEVFERYLAVLQVFVLAAVGKVA